MKERNTKTENVKERKIKRQNIKKMQNWENRNKERVTICKEKNKINLGNVKKEESK